MSQALESLTSYRSLLETDNYKLWVSGAVATGVAVYLGRRMFCGRDTFKSETLVRGRNVIVTGATSGVGRGIAIEFSRQGANVVITGRREDRLKKVVAECRAAGSADGKYEYFKSDMNDLDNVPKIVQFTVDRLGGVDYISMNHAYTDPSSTGFYRYTPEAFILLQKQFNINFFSCVKLLEAAMPHLKQSEGRVALTCSPMGRMPEMLISEHVGTKFAMDGFFRSLDLENYFLENNVSITMVFPGFVDTSQDDGALDSDPAQFEGLPERLDFDLMGRNVDGYYNSKPGSTEEYARELISATAKRETELYFPSNRIIVWWPILKYHIWPNWMKNIIRNYRLSKRVK